jgi:hypothetical protein
MTRSPASGPEPVPPGVAAVAAEAAPRGSWLARAENALSIAVLVFLTAIPLVDLVGREAFAASLPGGTTAVQYLTLWITFLGAALAARGDRLLALAASTLNTGRPLSGAFRYGACRW